MTANTTPPAATRVTRRPTSRAEIAAGIAWLSVGAVFSAILELAYLDYRVTVSDTVTIPLPITIVLALWFNWVLSRTARLWSTNLLTVSIPMLFWLVIYAVFVFGGFFGTGITVTPGLRTVALLVAGMVGGGFAFRGLK